MLDPHPAPRLVDGLERPLSAQELADERAPSVALLVDYPVLMRAVRAQNPDGVARLDAIVAYARALGSVFRANAYGAWYDLEEALAAFNAGLDPTFVPTVGPGTVPTATSLVADGSALIRGGQVHCLVLSGDDRLAPLAAMAQHEGIDVHLVAHSCRADGPCLRLATTAEPAAAYVRQLTRAERYRRPAGAARSA
jgi:hypothetical protein